MKKTSLSSALIYIPIFALSAVLTFLVYYLCSYISSVTALAYVSDFTIRLTTALYPLMVAALLTVYAAREKASHCYLIAIPFSLVYALYLYPHSYIESFASGYYLGDDAALYALFETLFYVLALYVEIAILFTFITVVIKKVGTDGAKTKREKENALLLAMEEDEAKNLSRPCAIAFFGAAGIRFIYSLTLEIVETVRFLIRYAETFTLGEVLYMVFSYIFILLIFLGSYVLAYKFRLRLFKK